MESKEKNRVRKPEEVEETIRLCKEYDIPITGAILLKHPKDLENTIHFITDNYGKEYLLPQIVICERRHVERVFAYLHGKTYMEYIKNSPNIIKLTLNEIVEREVYLHMIGESFVLGDAFHPVFNLSRKSFLERKKELEESKKQL